MGQYIGATSGAANTPSLAPIHRKTFWRRSTTCWDRSSATIPDHNGRPQYSLDDREPVKELDLSSFSPTMAGALS